ncbi:hypothetical protein GQX74_014398 [Glossina fuscipes]|nr:hypothetical protein GQX74_014398 [Glossina fuscipes]
MTIKYQVVNLQKASIITALIAKQRNDEPPPLMPSQPIMMQKFKFKCQQLLTLCVSNAFPTTANAAHQYSKHKDGKTGELPPTTSPLKSNGRPIHYYMQIFRQVLSKPDKFV